MYYQLASLFTATFTNFQILVRITASNFTYIW